MTKRKLIIFDVDGTLIDSQAHIVGAMRAGYRAIDAAPPEREVLLSVVGLSLPIALARLLPDLCDARMETMIGAYRDAFRAARADGAAPLYPGAREAIDALAARGDLCIGLATGASRRGLSGVIETHGLAGLLATAHCADDHPSKPDPSMVRAALADVGAAPEDAVVVGDTTYDMEMARAAGVAALGVSWGYHRPEDLRAAGACGVLEDFVGLEVWIDAKWGAIHG